MSVVKSSQTDMWGALFYRYPATFRAMKRRALFVLSSR